MILSANEPVFLSSKGLSGSKVHLDTVSSCIKRAQQDLFPIKVYPSGVRSSEELSIVTFSLYARAIRDLTQRDSVYGGRIARENYVFATNQNDLSWMLTTGLFEAREIQTGKHGDIVKTIDGLAFSSAGHDLLSVLEHDPEFMKMYSRSGVFKKLISMRSGSSFFIGRQLSIELTSPPGLLDPESAGFVKGKLLGVEEDSSRTIFKPDGTFLAVPSLLVKLELSHFSPSAVFRLAEKIGLTPKVHTVSERHLQKTQIEISLDEIFSINLLRPLNIREANFRMLPVGSCD